MIGLKKREHRSSKLIVLLHIDLLYHTAGTSLMIQIKKTGSILLDASEAVEEIKSSVML